jgi:hypothetical protein
MQAADLISVRVAGIKRDFFYLIVHKTTDDGSVLAPGV